ncbi:protein-tyrosine-phosphatase [Marivirga lumbricoides]
MKSTLMLNSQLLETIGRLPFQAITQERKAVLEKLVGYVQQRINEHLPVRLNFICTHNSRRSQLAQIWAKTAAAYHNVHIESYSGGVEVTGFNDRAVEAIKKAGFRVTRKGELNPKWFIFYSDDSEPVVAFSKLYDDAINPNRDFAAIMTCSHADENCPFIPGAHLRVPVRYEDPKLFDDTPLELQKYEERSIEIATEMFYVFSQIQKTDG